MRRSLGPFDVVCVGLNAIVGSGIFLLPDDLYRQVGWLSPLAFVACAIGLLPIALCYAEAARSVDQSGGPFVYATQAFGSRVGYLVGWMCFANSAFSFAAVATAAAASLGRVVPALDTPVMLEVTALSVIWLFAGLNYFGAKPGAIAVDTFTVSKFLVLLVLMVALVPEMSATRLSGAPSGTASGFATATFIALFAAQGFEVVSVPAGETRAPERSVPRAILGSLFAATLLYAAVQTVLVLSSDGLDVPTDSPLANAALAVAPGLGLLIAVGAVISTLGFVSGTALGTPRYLFAAARAGQLPAWLGSVHPKYSSPHLAVVATAALAAALALPFDYRSLLGMSNVAVAVQYLATCLAVASLRRKQGHPSARKPWVPIAGALVSLSIFTQASLEELAWAAAALVVGFTLRALVRRPDVRPS